MTYSGRGDNKCLRPHDFQSTLQIIVCLPPRSGVLAAKIASQGGLAILVLVSVAHRCMPRILANLMAFRRHVGIRDRCAGRLVDLPLILVQRHGVVGGVRVCNCIGDPGAGDAGLADRVVLGPVECTGQAASRVHDRLHLRVFFLGLGVTLTFVDARVLHAGEWTASPDDGVELAGVPLEGLGRLAKRQVHRVVPLLGRVDVLACRKLVVDALVGAINRRRQVALVKVRRVVQQGVHLQGDGFGVVVSAGDDAPLLRKHQ